MKKEERIQSFKKLQAIAKSKDLTVSRLARECEVPENLMTYWKQGRSVPKADKLIKIANRLEVPIETFIA